MNLEPPVTAVDNPHMAENDLLFDSLSEQNLLVLRSYAHRSMAAKAAGDEHGGWLDRLELPENPDPEELTRIHGNLIALGMLKFGLTNRQTGLQYRVSERGMSAIENQTAAVTSAATSSESAQAVKPVPSHSLPDVA